MKSTESGNAGEQAAADYLARRGFSIVERNFRTPRCEIDIIARKQKCLYFVEVKYRSHDAQGSGLEYITSRKLEHMQRAAELWLQEHEWSGEVQLAAVAVAADFTVTDFIELVA